MLAGADPGYEVYRPLLWFNTAMGFAYLAAAVAVWRHLRRGRVAALAIFGVNLLVLVAIATLLAAGQAVAITSVGAMTLRTGFWLIVALVMGLRPTPGGAPSAVKVKRVRSGSASG